MGYSNVKAVNEPIGDDDYKLDAWLCFPPQIALRYEEDHAVERIAHLRLTILIALLLYNCYNLVDAILLPDLGLVPAVLRTLVLTPFGLFIYWMTGRIGAAWRERALLAGCAGALALTIVLFHISASPMSLHAFGEFSLAIVFANMMAVLRFPHAVIFTSVAFVAASGALYLRSDVSLGLQSALLLQLATACLFSLYGNYLFQSRRRQDYLNTMSAERRAERAEREGLNLRDMARTDALTGLPNRRALDDIFTEWFASGDPVTVMMIDLDHFKEFNDSLGHQAGDECLKQIGTVLKAAASGDSMFAARYGGEEFAVALRHVQRSEAFRFVEGLIRAIGSLSIHHPHGIGGVVTVSVGLAFKNGGSDTSADHVLNYADQALYWAKREGRNRYKVAEDRGVEQDLVAKGRPRRCQLAS